MDSLRSYVKKWQEEKYMLKDKLRNVLTAIITAAVITGPMQAGIWNGAIYASAAAPSVKAKSYVVMDAASGDVLYKKYMNKKLYPASTVKLMTAVVAIEHAELDKKIKFTKKMKKLVPDDASDLGLKTGTSYSVKQYLSMMLIASDADSAIALAVGTGGSYDQFIQWMNSKAESYGMDKTSFDNPVGLDKGNGYNDTYTTAYDFSVLTRHAMADGTIRSIVARKKYKVPARKGKPSFTIKNTNGFYSSHKLKGKQYSIIGSKTGTTNAAGHVLIVTARDDEGHEVICASFGSSTSVALYNGIEKLLDYTFKQYENGKTDLSAGEWETRFQE